MFLVKRLWTRRNPQCRTWSYAASASLSMHWAWCQRPLRVMQAAWRAVSFLDRFSLLATMLKTFLAMFLGSMGAPAGPSLDALVTRAAGPGEIGRVLAGFSIIQSAIVSLRGPVLFLVYSMTLERYHTVIWWFVAVSVSTPSALSEAHPKCKKIKGLLGMCAIIMAFLRPARFVSKQEDGRS